jgi:hypothetical protein
MAERGNGDSTDGGWSDISSSCGTGGERGSGQLGWGTLTATPSFYMPHLDPLTCWLGQAAVPGQLDQDNPAALGQNPEWAGGRGGHQATGPRRLPRAGPLWAV